MEDRLEDPADGRLADETEAEGRERHAKLDRRDVRVERHDDRHRFARAEAPGLDELLQLRATHPHERVLGGHEERVHEKEEDEDDEGQAARARVHREGFSHVPLTSMNVPVRLFASAREAAGVGHLLLELPAGATVRDAIARITTEHPLVGEIREMVIARNREYVGLEEPLADGDELALIPPVSGGAVSAPARVLVSDQPLSLDAAIPSVGGPDARGLVVFLPTVPHPTRATP